MEEESQQLPLIARVLKEYRVPLLLGGISILSIVISVVLLVKSIQTATPIEFSSGKTASGSSVLGESIIKVDVEGAVVHPGLYSLPQDSRVEDAIAAAGGLTANVDDALFSRNINRAMKLVDGGKLFIPTNDSSLQTSPGAMQSDKSGLISVNSATESELDTLSGVGPVTARKIIDNRPYQTLDELVSKKALGTALYEKIKNQLSL